MTEDPGNDYGRMSKIPEDVIELKPMELNNDPKSCEMKISSEIKKLQEGSGMFGDN